jgi:hypothetical protein
MNKIFLGVIGAAATILAASAASAATAIIDGITVNDYGRVNPAGPDYAQPGVGTGPAQIQIGQVNVMPPNPPEFGNPGWNPYGASDTTHPWWNIEGGQVTMNEAGDALTIVWGSPNDNNPAATNIVSFYSGANGTGWWILTRGATPSTALVPQQKVGFPITNPRLLLGFQRTKTARREGISSPFSDAGVALRPRTQAPRKRPTPWTDRRAAPQTDRG